MKLLELCLSPDLGGLELYAFRTAITLRKLAVNVDLFLSPNSKLAALAEAEHQPYTLFRKRSKVLPLVAALNLARHVDRNGIDIIHVHWAKDIALAILAKKLAARQVRIIYTRQMEILGSKKDIYHNFIYGNTDLLITITDRLRNQVLQYTNMHPENVVCLYHGVDRPDNKSNLHCREFRSDHGIDQEAFIVGLIGRIEEFKCQHLLVDALDRLTKLGLNVHGVIAGSAINEKYLAGLKKQVSHGKAGGNITFLGFQQNPEHLMVCFDALVLATRLETFGLVLIEAMASGVPVIGTNAGGVPEIIDDGETGLLFPPDDAGALADKISLFMNNPELKNSCSRNGQIKACEVFSSEKHFSDLFQLIKNVAG